MVYGRAVIVKSCFHLGTSVLVSTIVLSSHRDPSRIAVRHSACGFGGEENTRLYTQARGCGESSLGRPGKIGDSR